ncbi:hypothetical protein SESBI_08515 [Sesbania bispinosa]|nr:hypothetical protein SESBI_08515 [Sesbania bispinosa]
MSHGGPQLLLAALTEGTAWTTFALARLWAAWTAVLAAWTRTVRTNGGRRSEDARLGREETRQQEKRLRHGQRLGEGGGVAEGKLESSRAERDGEREGFLESSRAERDGEREGFLESKR